MSTFARIVDGIAVDVKTTPPSLGEQFNPEWLARQTFIQVPDGTLIGAQDNGDGTFTNPVIPPAPKVAQELSGVAFHTYCAGVLAQVNNISPTQGMARLGDVIHGMSGQGGLVSIAYQRYAAAGAPGGKFTFSDIPTLMGALQSAGIATAQESAAIINNWPKA